MEERNESLKMVYIYLYDKLISVVFIFLVFQFSFVIDFELKEDTKDEKE